jgi:hypothetical protein
LDSGTVGNGLIVGVLVDLLAVEEVRDELHDTGITRITLVDLGVPENLLDDYHTAPRNEHR